MPKLIESYHAVLKTLDDTLPIFIGGKSMGGRVAATLISKDLNSEYLTDNVKLAIKGVICLGYPFHPVKQLEKLRLEPLQKTQKSVLIVQGDRDALGNQQEIALYDLSSQCQFVFLEDGNHDFKPRVKSGFTQEVHIKSAANAMVRFINEMC